VIPTHNNTTGKVDFVGSVVPPATPYSGAAPVGVGGITWKVVSCPASGQIPLTLVNTKLSDPNGAAITYTRSDSSIVCPPPQALPAAPNNLTASAMSSSQIDLAWADNANNEDGFKIERCAGTGCTNLAQITTVPANATGHSDMGLTAETTYCYRVRAFNAGGDSDYSNVACATTPAPLAAPNNLTASAVSSSQIDLAWADNANNENGFKIERCAGTGCTSFAQITAVTSNITSHSDTGLTAVTTYCYRVRAFNSGGDSDYSNLACATTPSNSKPSGIVLLQGRTDHSGTAVYLTEDACPAVQAVSIKGLPNVVTAVTDAAGKFTLEPLPGRTYQCVLATHDMYLTARRSNMTVALPQVTLLGGNVVADKTINIFDLARIANSIGTSDSTVDINGDGKVDVFDLTIAAGNFGKEGPLPW
jgi:hypothetical protein